MSTARNQALKLREHAARQRYLSERTLPPGTLDRLMARISPEPNTGCWLWLGRLDRHGYPTLYSQGLIVAAHRASYELAFGPLGPGLFACRRCDTPACVNPEHLFAGTGADNVADRVRKGRCGNKVIFRSADGRIARAPRPADLRAKLSELGGGHG